MTQTRSLTPDEAVNQLELKPNEHLKVDIKDAQKSASREEWWSDATVRQELNENGAIIEIVGEDVRLTQSKRTVTIRKKPRRLGTIGEPKKQD